MKTSRFLLASAVALGLGLTPAENYPPAMPQITADDSSLYNREPPLSFKEEADYRALVGKQAPPLQQHDINPQSPTSGKYVGPQDYKEKVVFLSLWASWCGPCREELSELAEFQRAHPKDVAVLVLEANVKSDWQSVDLSALPYPVLEKKGKAPFTFAICLESACTIYWKGKEYKDMGPLLAEYVYGLSAFPTTFIIDRQQTVREVVVGGMQQRHLEKLLEEYQ